MQVIRTIFWVVLAVLLLVFVVVNWKPVLVIIWPLETDPIFVQWPLGLIVIASFFAGVLPMWLWSKAGQWRLLRRITALENSVRAVTATPPLAAHGPIDSAEAEALEHRHES